MSRIEPRRSELATGILVAGAIIYAILCGPAIGCRGYPPLDPFWYGVTFLWPIPVCISGFFDSIKLGTRLTQLIVFSLVTSFIFAGTMVTMVPRNIRPEEMLFGVVLFGPVHVVLTFLVELTVQWLYSFGRRLDDFESGKFPRSYSLFACLTFITWISVIVGLPIGYRSIITTSVNSKAVKRAEQEWGHGACLFGNYAIEQIGDVTVEFAFDPTTGLQISHKMADLGFSDAYNQRIQQLVELNGLPRYSIKSIIPVPADLIQLLDSTEMVAVNSLPTDLNENIHLMRRGTFSRWGRTITIMSDSLSVVTRHGTFGVGEGVFPVYVKVTDEIVYVRNGSNWIGAFLPDGSMIASASR